MDGSGEGQMMVRWSGKVQVRVKYQKYSELDIGGRETCSITAMKNTNEYHSLLSHFQPLPSQVKAWLPSLLTAGLSHQNIVI